MPEPLRTLPPQIHGRSNIIRQVPKSLSLATDPVQPEATTSWGRSRPDQINSEVSSGAGDDSLVVLSVIVDPIHEIQAVAARNVQEEIPGATIRDLENGLVLCRVTMGGQEIEITLPSDSFDFEFGYGTPFNLSMADRGGFRVPVVAPRLPAPVDNDLQALFDATLELYRA